MEKKKEEYGIITEQGDLGGYVALTEEEQDVLRKKSEEKDK